MAMNKVDLLHELRYLDLDDPCSETLDKITSDDIRWLIDHFGLDQHNAKIFGMRWRWEHKHYSRKQRWMVIAESHKRERALFT